MHADAYTPGHALHLIQRGACRQACFASHEDRAAYLERLAHAAREVRCAVHAYVLMGNHVHLLATPCEKGAATRLMRSLAAHDRELWEPEFETWPVFPRRYLFACMRYIELNPVRACLAQSPGQYRWSSYGANALGSHDPAVTPHPFYLSLGRTAPTRQALYRNLFRSREAAFASGR